ncbi:MAG TPA: winged helix-turn-helix domain-containing protein [Steroidobacteraceae bacterium]|jgi:TolB-like protein/DNA-binding winged helix-turn-helix (wHTH) protein|nr:winged helix-turn-helix domain-containing protein [Steroidobacteraceae bacterium]
MDQPSGTSLRVGAWRVNPASGQISREGETVRVEARTMRLLLCLADRAGEVVSIDALLAQVWTGVIVTPDSVYQAITSLRRLLGDDPKQPTYIATVPRLGYRMVAAVSPWAEPPVISPAAPERADSGATSHTSSHKSWTMAGAGAALAVAVVLALLVYGRIGNNVDAASTSHAALARNSVAVLPFLDLTSESMDQEYFADGMTEELIDRLSKIPGLRVPPPTSSFYYKGRKASIADIARSLSVAYVLDGSLRKSGSTMRVAARLVRADNGFVVWAETYDRRLDDTLKVQDDIAGEVTKALRQSIDSR